MTTQLELKDGGGFAKVAWIDTEGTFTAKRIVQIADRFNLEPRCVLDNILVARTFTSEMMHNAVVALAAKMAEAPFKLLVVDSVMAHFRVDFVGRGELSERQQKLGQFLAMLNKLADEFNVAVVYTNQVQADPSGMSFAGADPKKAVGGHVLAHASHVRCSVRKGRGGTRVLKVVDAPNLKEAEAEFEITDGGSSPRTRDRRPESEGRVREALRAFLSPTRRETRERTRDETRTRDVNARRERDVKGDVSRRGRDETRCRP